MAEDPISPQDATIRLLHAIALSPDRDALDTPARVLIKAWRDAGYPMPPMPPAPEPIRRAHAYERKRRP